jgi:ABC-type phosphate transport system substrate-binding protein
VLGSLLTAGPSFAGVPGGAACQATNGKISGRGSTFQGPAFTQVFIPGYENDICGTVALQYTGDPAGATMIAYNYNSTTSTPVHVALTGSGQGEQAVACRTDAFGGTDLPYDQARLQAIWGAPGTWTFDGFANCDELTQNANATPPYTPSPNAASPFYPSTANGATNAQANMMSFPVAGGAAAIGVHFNAADTNCPHTAAATTLTTAQMSQIFSGEISNWSSVFPGCNLAITRVVRSDVSGTTQGVKDYFAKSSPTDGTCGSIAGANWSNTYVNINNNQTWPSGGTCASNLVTANGTGNCSGAGSGVIGQVCNTDGAITYGDLRSWAPPLTPGPVFLASLQTAASAGGTPVFVNAGVVGGLSNCNISGVAQLPGGGTASDFVGLNSADGITPSPGNWGTDGTPTVSNITYTGSKWPICTLTYDMMFAGTSAANPGGPTGGLTDNQRRTLYSFFLYVMSPAGQAGLASHGYDPLPASWLNLFRTGFAGAGGAF